MKGDFSRIRLSRGKGYTSVLEQQGRVSLDADANEQRILDERLRRTETTDAIGQFGAPSGDAGFAITIASNGVIQIGAGRYYVNGLQCENPAPVAYDTQPFVTSVNNSGALLAAVAGGKQAVQFYLRAWQRLVTVLDDPCLHEPALGGADTTARVQVAWQVIPKIVTYDPSQPPGACCAGMYAAQQTTASKGTLSVGVGGSGADCGCGPVAAAGYQGIENQLYRVEIHTGGDLTPANSATFKWSRENGSVVSAVTSATQGNETVTLSSLGPDANLGFQAQQWVELTDDTYDLADPPGAPGVLYQVQVPDKDALTLQFYAPVSQPVNTALHAKARRWDQSGPTAGPAGIPLASGAVVPEGMQFELEYGITVTFGPGTYQPGDYWTFPARTMVGRVEWPPCDSDGKSFQRPWSTEIYEAPLACMHIAGETPVNFGGIHLLPTGISGTVQPGPSGTSPVQAPPIEDCRRIFQPLAPTAVHVTGINWPNDDLLPVDLLAANGLRVMLDQAVDGPVPVDSGRFIVTLEAFYEPFLEQSPGGALRTDYVLDSKISVTGHVLTWRLPQGITLDYVERLRTEATRYGQHIRVRVRLPGHAYFTTGASGPVYLDGRALGQSGTRGDGKTPRIDLRLPSGDSATYSDLESWFYLAEPTVISSVAIAYPRLTAVLDGSFEGVQVTGATGPLHLVAQSATIYLASHASVPVPVDLALTSVSGNPAAIASIQPSVVIQPGQSWVTVPVSITASPGFNAAAEFTITASRTSQLVPEWNTSASSPACMVTGPPSPIQ